MKKLIGNKKIVQKILVAIIIVLMFNFIIPSYSQADFGGILLIPIFELFNALGDTLVAGLQYALMDGDFVMNSSASLFDWFEVYSAQFNRNEDVYYWIKYKEPTTGEPYIFYMEDFHTQSVEDNLFGSALKRFLITGIPVYGIIKNVMDFADGTYVQEAIDSTQNVGIEIPLTKYTPDAIFRGLVPAFDINFIKPKDWSETDEGKAQQTQVNALNGYIETAKANLSRLIDEMQQEGTYNGEPIENVIRNNSGLDNGIDKETFINNHIDLLERLENTDAPDIAMNQRSVALQLHDLIATWYVALRNLAIVGLMVILVYVGIRMVISSTASDKAKYKQMLLDWLIAMCLLFCLHYIMLFTVTITEQITKAIGGSDGSISSINTIPVIVNKENGTEEVRFSTNLMGLAAFQTKSKDAGPYALYSIIYLAFVIYTVMFTFTYLKRTIMMAFLTLMAPLVVLTYPIDKLTDGKAQAFNAWLKEYIFNALIQPFHLLIYTVFIGSAMGLASSNPVYALVALAFITPAEKLLRKFFGFEKSSTAGTLNAFSKMVGGAAAYKMISKAVNHNKGKDNNNKNIRTRDKDKALKDPNAPSGVDGFTENNVRAIDSGHSEGNSNNNNNTNRNISDAPLENLNNNSHGDLYHHNNSSRNSINDEDTSTLPDWAKPSNTRMTSSGIILPNTRQPRKNNSVSTKPQNNTSQNSNLMPQNTMIVDSKRSFGNKLLGGFRGAGRAIANRATTTLGNKYWVAQKAKNLGLGALKGTAHLAGRVAAGAAIGSLGLAAGIAGDDLEDVLTYGVGGAVLGATVGGNKVAKTMDNIGLEISNSAPVQGFAEGYTGKTETERTLEKQKQNLVADSNFMRSIQQEYQPEDEELRGNELVEATERAADFYNYGITNPEEIAKALKVEDKIKKDLEQSSAMNEEIKRQLAKEQAATAMKMASRIQNPNKLADDEFVNQQINSWTKTIRTKNPSLSEKDARSNAEQIMKRVKQIKKVD